MIARTFSKPLEALADLVEQAGEGGIERRFRDGGPGAADVAQFRKVTFKGVHISEYGNGAVRASQALPRAAMREGCA
jgi:hypothetical protein